MDNLNLPLLRGGRGIDINLVGGKAIEISSNQEPWFIARITQVGPLVSLNEGRSGGSWSGSGSGSVSPSLTSTAYGWKEQIPNLSGAGYMDKTDGLEGDVSADPFINPAFEINDNELVVGDYVLMRRKCYSDLIDQQSIFECFKSGGASTVNLDIEVVTDITFTNCNLVVTKQTIRIPGGSIV